MNSHPSFPQPINKDTKVWKYMNLAKFISLLSKNQLHFTRIDLFDDNFEGSITSKNHYNRKKFLETVTSEESAIRALSDYKEALKLCYANCWRIDDYESEAMWKLYCPLNMGIAIQTTYDKLKKSIEHEKDLFIGLINYIDYEVDSFGENNIFFQIMHKRISFSHEKEVRIATFAPFTSKNNNEIPPKPEGLTIDWQHNNVIESIYVNPYAPNWYLGVVKDIIQKYELKYELKWSNLKKIPLF